MFLSGCLSEGNVIQCQVYPAIGARSAGTATSPLNLGMRSRYKTPLAYLKKEQRLNGSKFRDFLL